MNWRLIRNDGVSDGFGLAADETLAQRVGEGKSLPTLRLYTYSSHCALVGRFQNVENELHVDYCRSAGIPVNRRPTGGGAIIMGQDQLGIALMIPGRGEDSYRLARELMARFSEGITNAFKQLGIRASFSRKNDIEVNGRKIVGLGIHRASSGGLLFHGSVLVDLNVPLMLKVLKTPFEKISDKEITTIAARITTLRKELGEELSVDDFRDLVIKGYSSAFDVELIQGDFTGDELSGIRHLESAKYQSAKWIYQNSNVPDAVGTARTKTPGGLLDVRVVLAGQLLKAVYIGGDFFTSAHALADLEGTLRWHSRKVKTIETSLQAVYEKRAADLAMIPLQALVATVQKAVQRAKIIESHVTSDPYGCFVTPGESYA